MDATYRATNSIITLATTIRASPKKPSIRSHSDCSVQRLCSPKRTPRFAQHSAGIIKIHALQSFATPQGQWSGLPSSSGIRRIRWWERRGSHNSALTCAARSFLALARVSVNSYCSARRRFTRGSERARSSRAVKFDVGHGASLPLTSQNTRARLD